MNLKDLSVYKKTIFGFKMQFFYTFGSIENFVGSYKI